MGKNKGNRTVFDSGTLNTREEKMRAYDEGVQALMSEGSIDESTARASMQHELNKALADSGPGRILVKTDIADREVVFTPMYHIEGKRTDAELESIIHAGGQELSEGETGILEHITAGRKN